VDYNSPFYALIILLRSLGLQQMFREGGVSNFDFLVGKDQKEIAGNTCLIWCSVWYPWSMGCPRWWSPNRI